MNIELEHALNSIGWIVRKTVDGYELENYSPKGEDLIVELYGNEYDYLRTLKENFINFDAEEHAMMWYGKNRGEPSSIRELLEDADDIEQMFKILYTVVKNYTLSLPIEKRSENVSEN